MRLQYQATIDDHVHASFRLFERTGEAKTFFRFGLIMAPVILLFPQVISDSWTRAAWIGSVSMTIYLTAFILRYRNFLRKRFRRVTINALEGEGPFASEIETDSVGVVSSSQGQEVKFHWDRLQEVQDTSFGIEVLFAPNGIFFVPNHAFSGLDERAAWMSYFQRMLKEHALPLEKGLP